MNQDPIRRRADKIKNSTRGFTLVETLVTILVFSFMVLVFGSIFAHAINVQRRAFNLQQVSENANFALEAMAKEIRVSQISGVSTNCPTSPVSTLAINHPVNGSIVYSLSGQAIHRQVGGADTTLSSNTVEFSRLQFCLTGLEANDQRQPRVTILATVQSRNLLQRAILSVQTTVSQRFLND